MAANWEGVNHWQGDGVVSQPSAPHSALSFNIDLVGRASLLTREFPVSAELTAGNPNNTFVYTTVRNQLVTHDGESIGFTRRFSRQWADSDNGGFTGSGDELPGPRTLVRSERIEDVSTSDYVVDPQTAVSIGGTPLEEELATWLFALEGDQGEDPRQRAAERFELRVSQLPEHQVVGQREVLLVMQLGDAAVEGGPPRWTAEIRLEEEFGWQPTFRELWRHGVDRRSLAERIGVFYESLDGHWLPVEWYIMRYDAQRKLTWEQTVEIDDQQVSVARLNPEFLDLENLGLREGDQMIGTSEGIEVFQNGAWQASQVMQVFVPRTIEQDGRTITVYEAQSIGVGATATQVNPPTVEPQETDQIPHTEYVPSPNTVQVPAGLSHPQPVHHFSHVNIGPTVHHFRHFNVGPSREVHEEENLAEVSVRTVGEPYANSDFTAAPPAQIAAVDDPADAERQRQIADAIDKGVAFLRDNQTPDGHWTTHFSGTHEVGLHSLALLSLLKAGHTVDEPAVAKALDWLREQEDPDQTYSVALAVMALVTVNDEADRDQIRRFADWLEDSQTRSGAWGYSIGDGGNWWDNSNSQYAVYGLYAAHQYGINVDLDVVRHSIDHYLAQQTGDLQDEQGAGWNYRGRVGGAVSGNMTASAIASLNMLSVILADQEVVDDDDSARLAAATTAIESGQRWLETHFSVRTNPGEQSWVLCYLANLARAGELSELQLIGDHDWYREGADYLVQSQNRIDGSCAALLKVTQSWPRPWHCCSFQTEVEEQTATAAVIQDEQRLITFHFENAPWAEVLEHFGELTGTTVDIQAVPEGTFSYVDRRHFTLPQALGVLNSFLNQRGCVLLHEGDTLIVMPADQAPSNPLAADFPIQRPESPYPTQQPTASPDPFGPSQQSVPGSEETRSPFDAPETVGPSQEGVDPFAQPSSSVVLIHLIAADDGSLGELRFFTESLGTGPAAMESLGTRLAQFKAELATRRQLFRITAQITADENLQYGAVIGVINACQSAEIEEIKFSLSPMGEEVSVSLGYLRDAMGRRLSDQPIIVFAGSAVGLADSERFLQIVAADLQGQGDGEGVAEVVLVLTVDSEIPAEVVRQVIQHAQDAGFEKFTLNTPRGNTAPDAASGPPATIDSEFALQGLILEVGQDLQTVVLSIGADDGVRSQQRFGIYRQTEEERRLAQFEYVGECEVVELQADQCVARIVSIYDDRAPVVEGDHVYSDVSLVTAVIFTGDRELDRMLDEYRDLKLQIRNLSRTPAHSEDIQRLHTLRSEAQRE